MVPVRKGLISQTLAQEAPRGLYQGPQDVSLYATSSSCSLDLRDAKTRRSGHRVLGRSKSWSRRKRAIG